MSFFQQGAQPAEALPSTTIAYASIDLDPSGSQKIDAFKTLNKFPAFKDQVGIHSVDDVRQKLGDELIKGLGCDGLTFDDDIDPWLGNRAAVAAVDTGGAKPGSRLGGPGQGRRQGRGRAEEARRLRSRRRKPSSTTCTTAGRSSRESQKTVDEVVSETDHASLADDSTYQKWTKAVGDSGVVNLYAAPAAGDYLAHQLGDLENNLGGLPASAPVTAERDAALRRARPTTRQLTVTDARRRSTRS